MLIADLTYQPNQQIKV